MDIDTNALDRLVQSANRSNEDNLAETFMLTSQACTYLNKKREGLKDQILSAVKPQYIDKYKRKVMRSKVSEAFRIIGRTFTVTATIKSSGTTVDLDILKANLRVSETAWQNAIQRATLDRTPSLTLSVTKRIVK